MSYAAAGYDVPSGVNPITQLHQEEMVLPARIANPMRQMIGNMQAANFNAPEAANSAGGTHVHNWNIQAMDGASFQDFLEGHQDHFQRAFSTMARGGKFQSLGIDS